MVLFVVPVFLSPICFYLGPQALSLLAVHSSVFTTAFQRVYPVEEGGGGMVGVPSRGLRHEDLPSALTMTLSASAVVCWLFLFSAQSLSPLHHRLMPICPISTSHIPRRFLFCFLFCFSCWHRVLSLQPLIAKSYSPPPSSIHTHIVYLMCSLLVLMSGRPRCCC